MSETNTCGCCEGIEILTPAKIANRPGLEAITYRAGTHASFLETMLAALSLMDLRDLNEDGAGSNGQSPINPLLKLKTRDLFDPAIAMLDAWALVADVLSFYQERIANEGFLRTAIERRSVLELAKLVGYKLQPGVAATAYLAFTMEDGAVEKIPVGTRAQSIPGPGEFPQFFETAEEFEARAVWNILKPRTQRPQDIDKLNIDFLELLYLKGTDTNLKTNDPLLFVFGKNELCLFLRSIDAIEENQDADRTTVSLKKVPKPGLIQGLVTEIESGMKKNMEMYLRDVWTLGRDGYYFDSDNLGYTGELLHGPIDDNGIFVNLPWTARYQVVNKCNQLIEAANDLSPTAQAGIKGFAKAIRAYQLLLLTNLYNNIRLVDENNRITDSLFDRDTALAAISAELLEAIAILESGAGESFKFCLSDGFAGFRTPRTFVKFLHALSARVKAYQGNASAILAELDQSFLDADGDLDFGVYLTYAADRVEETNPLFEIPDSADLKLHVHPSFETDAEAGDARFAGKIFKRANPDNFDDLSSDLALTLFDNAKAPFPIIRNEELILLRAEAYIKVGDLSQAEMNLNIIRTAAGLPLYTGTDTSNAEDRLLFERRYSLLGEGHRWIDMRRYSRLNVLPIDRTGDIVIGDLPVPANSEIDESLIIMTGPAGRDFSSVQPGQNGQTTFSNLRQLVEPLSTEPSIQPQNMVRLNRNKKQLYSSKTDIAAQLLVNQNRLLQATLYSAWARTQSGATSELENLFAFRVKAAPFGYNAPLQLVIVNNVVDSTREWELKIDLSSVGKRTLPLDNTYDEIKEGSWVIIERPCNSEDKDIRILRVESVNTVAEADYGMSAKVTRLTLSGEWIEEDSLERLTRNTTKYSLSSLRDITIYAQSEPLELAQAPIVADVKGDTITLDGLFDSLASGRWIVVSGERTDVITNSEQGRVQASELVMLAGVEQTFDPDLPGDTPHTVLKLANKLAYKYKRDTVAINGNVVRATHGETKTEVLGSGDSGKALQTFELKQSPLTYLAAANPRGIESSLEVRVNDVEWHESDSLAEKQPDDRLFVTQTDNESKTSVQFGNGRQGARIPSGQENVRAVYRVGIGEGGNVKAKQISMLVTKPVGAKSVSNPLPATGGANREELSQARRNAPIPLLALDRTVSVSDFADFARAFSGIGKADAVRLSDGRRELVHLTIAGTNDIPIDRSSDLFRNLKRALHLFGDPNQPLQVAVRELKLIIVIANVRILPDFKWEAVEPQIKKTMLDVFGFENRAMGQDVLSSEVISTIQSVDGVDFVDLDALDALSSEDVIDNLDDLAAVLTKNQPKKRIRIDKARVDFSAADPGKRIRPAQLAMLSPNVPDTLVLSERT